MKATLLFAFYVATSVVLLESAHSQDQVADLIISGGQVATMDAARPKAESIAIANGRILAVGSDVAVAKYLGDKTQRLQLNGEFVMPGFIEGHALSLIHI